MLRNKASINVKHQYYKHILQGLQQQDILQQQQGRNFGHLGQEHFHLKQLLQEQSGHEHDGKMQQFLLQEIFLQQLDRGHEQLDLGHEQLDQGHEQLDWGHEQPHRHFGSGQQQAHGLQLH